MLFLGFSAGIQILLIYTSLSLWLREAGVQRAAVTFFSWAALGYAFKFIWAPLIDRLPVPLLTRLLGRRRAWMLVAQILIIIARLGMALTDPASLVLSISKTRKIQVGNWNADQVLSLTANQFFLADVLAEISLDVPANNLTEMP